MTTLLDPVILQPLAAELIARDRWSRTELLALQRRRLDEILRTAVSTSPYYRERLGAAVAAGASLADLPVLTKTVLMDEWDRIVTDPRLRLRDVEAHLAGERCGELLFGEYRAFASGGTTGERAVVIYDRTAWLDVIANVLRWVRTLGGGPECRVVGVGAPTALHITNRAFAELRAIRGDAPRLSVLTPLPELVATLNAYQPELLMTYPSFARRILEEQESGRLQIRPRRIGSTAEVLSPDVRSRVRATWNAPVLDTYGTTEAGLLGTECDAVRGIHIAEDMVVFEVVDERNRRVPAGTPGSKVLLTSLFNRTLPLIRYELSDLVTLAEGACECGRPYARVTAIEGRREDYLVFHAKGGGSVRIHAARLRGPLDGVPGLRQFQLVPGEGRLTLRLSVRGDARADEIVASALAAVRTALAEADADVQVTGELVDAIERAGTGAKEKLVALA